ncbi:MAG TPA: DUF4394 domain-containing protein [Blastocatellia bacterium]|nr:DUF4394 domain-containing protein [Blastocatellia bacterium]
MALLVMGFLATYSTSAGSGFKWSITAATSAATSTAQALTLPKTNIYALTSDSMLYVLANGRNTFTRVGSVPKTNGNLIGIDFRPANNQLYALTDTGKLLVLTPTNSSVNATLVSSLTPRFAGGFQSLMDFNPVVDAIRLIGSNDQNFAVVSSNGGILNTTAVQTPVAYASGDTNAGVNPNLVGGAYNNNVAGATTTIFYAIDYDLDTFVTIANITNGSSATGGGQLKTLGPIVDGGGNPVNINPTADIDIFTNANGINSLVGINGQSIFTIDLNQVNINQPLGTRTPVRANSVTLPVFPTADSFIDIAVQTVGGQAATAAQTASK